MSPGVCSWKHGWNTDTGDEHEAQFEGDKYVSSSISDAHSFRGERDLWVGKVRYTQNLKTGAV